jgi:hypothetical protein
MSDYYSITIKVTFGVLADSEEEAERIAIEECDIEHEVPSRACCSTDIYLTPNQSDDIKRGAVNHE